MSADRKPVTTVEEAEALWPPEVIERYRALRLCVREQLRDIVFGNGWPLGVIELATQAYTAGWHECTAALANARPESAEKNGDARFVAVPARPAELASRPVVVCLCGSTRFWSQMAQAAREETVAGRIVVRPDCDLKTPDVLWPPTRIEQVKRDLDALHRAKIRLCDEVLVVAPGGYVGESTRREIAYAQELGRPIRYWLGQAADGAGPSPTAQAAVQPSPDDREYRTELVWAPATGSAWSEQPGWTLFVDGRQVATTPVDLSAEAAQQWANSVLGEGVAWAAGNGCWYFVANPSTPRGAER